MIERRRRVLAIAAVLSVVGLALTVRLYSDLRSELEELLPSSSPTVQASHRLLPQIHALDHLSIVVRGKDPDALERFADALVARLKKLPPRYVEFIDYRTDDQMEFLRRFGLFYLTVDELKEVQKRIDARIAWERRKLLLTGFFDEADDPKPSVDFSDILKKYGGGGTSPADFRNGYFQTAEGNLLVVIVRPPESTTGYEQNRAVLDAVKAEVAALHPEKQGIEVGYGGDTAGLVAEQESLVSDIASSTIIVLVLVVAVLYAYYRRWSAIAAIALALGVGCALTFGLAEVLIGNLNANTGFLGSIVIGNGINPSLIYVARYLEERRAGRDILSALHVTSRVTRSATFVASFAAGLAYLSLASTQFRGFSQFGVIGGIGMALNWLACYALLPPLLYWLDRKPVPPLAPSRLSVGTWAERLVGRFPRAIRWGSLGLLLAAVGGVATYHGHVIEYDLSKLGSAHSIKDGASYWTHQTDQVFKAYLTPIAVVGNDVASGKRVAEALRRRVKDGDQDLVREVRTIDSMLPKDVEEKLPLIAHLRDTLSDGKIKRLSPENQKKVREVRPPKDLRAPTFDDLPEAIRLPLILKNGDLGRVALIFPKPLGALSPTNLGRLHALVTGAIADVGGQAEAVGRPLLFYDITAAILADGPLSTGVSFALVCLLVVLVLRRPRPVLLVLTSLVVGVAWLVGAAAWARVRVNFLNFITLPITFGIGVDYAVNIVQRYWADGQSSMGQVLRQTGGAVALCSATTIIGYSSLIVADSKALAQFGLLATIGEFACLSAALVALPAWMAWRGRAAKAT